MLRIVMPEDRDRAAILARLERRSSASTAEIERSVQVVIAEVRARGDEAVRSYTAQWEKRTLGDLELARTDWEREAAKVSPDVRAAIERARDRIRRFHELQRAHTIDSGYVLDDGGVRLELRVQALRRVGLYVPGGSARYPSSVLMTAVPAKVAGVTELIMVTPGASPETLFAAMDAPTPLPQSATPRSTSPAATALAKGIMKSG